MASCNNSDDVNIDAGNSISNDNWSICARKIPRSEIIYFTQVTLIFVVVCVCLFNLTSSGESKDNSPLWSSLLSGCLGYLLPSPRLKKKKGGRHEPFLSNSTIQ